MLAYLRSIQRSLIAFLATIALSLLSMGFLGAGLYFLVFFALPSSYPHINDLRGDWVWPAIIGVGMAWSVGFLFAGEINRRLELKRIHAMIRKFIYVAVLWLWALALWWLTFALQGL